MSATTSDADAARVLDEALEHVGHLLPEQTPLQSFVHHNTLHAFEHLPFEQAVLEGARVYGTEPYMEESAFALHLASGRILRQDVDEVLAAESSDDEPRQAQLMSRTAFRKARLRHLFELPTGAALEWQLIEGDARRAFHPTVDVGRRSHLLRGATLVHGPLPEGELTARSLSSLWRQLERAAPERCPQPSGPRRRDELLAAAGVDIDQQVQPLLIRLTSSFLDQGLASWHMPDVGLGLLRATRRLLGMGAGSPDPWRRGLGRELRRQEREGWDARRTCAWALTQMGLELERWPDVVQATLLSLRGWAGMVQQFALRPDRAPVEPRPAALDDYLALYLTLELFAARHALRTAAEDLGGFEALTDRLRSTSREPDRELVYEAFVLAQALEVDVVALYEARAAQSWLDEVRSFDALERRRVMHLAFERRHRVEVLDGIIAHCRLSASSPPAPRFKAVFCFDERECSTRRHLEEAFPDVETFGYAGFFGVAMAYQGLGDLRPKPLCPVNVVPRHLVRERALRPEEEAAYLAARRRQGSVAEALPVGGSTFTRAGLLTPLLGLASVVPLIGRCLFPRLAGRVAARWHHASSALPVSRLALERRSEELDEHGRAKGYSLAEMADVVEGMLRTIAMELAEGQLVLVVGHGSSSLNNPHEAAHDCGATGGGRGGPNARAFASMANRPGVREILAQRGLKVPETTWFVGAYHNTCDDSMQYFDLDLVPDTLVAELRHARTAMQEACKLDAHERCRRFGSAPEDLDLEHALAHAEAHAMDLAQPRPEYGHATNAVAIVGRRSRTRGLFLDRRAFLISYDPLTDPESDVLAQLLSAVVPVGAGINLEYYFSFVDPTGYGCGTKLPHNIVGLIGVMDGHASDLRTGLPWQMVEIHEPVRLLAIIEALPKTLEGILSTHPALASVISNGWIQVVAWEPGTDRMHVLGRQGFVEYVPENPRIPVVQHSAMFYRGQRGHLGLARADAALAGALPAATSGTPRGVAKIGEPA